MSDIPVQLQRASNLFSLNEKLRSLRSELDLLSSKAQSGSFSIKALYKDIFITLDSTLAEMVLAVESVLIPPDVTGQFVDGFITLDDYGDFDSLQYYNGLRKFQFSLNGLKAVLFTISDAPESATLATTSPEPGVADVVQEEEFLQQGFESPVSEEIPEYVYYMIRQGDTLQSIAQTVLNDHTRAAEIARAADISENDLIDGTQIGRTIRIPVGSISAARSDNSLVYEPFLVTVNGQPALDQFFYGRDLMLVDKVMQADAYGHLRITSGVPCVVANIEQRVNTPVGTLNPQSPTFGVVSLNNPGRIPFAIFLDRIISDMEAQALSDPRVATADINRRKIRLERDALFVRMLITLNGGQVFEMPIVVNPTKVLP